MYCKCDMRIRIWTDLGRRIGHDLREVQHDTVKRWKPFSKGYATRSVFKALLRNILTAPSTKAWSSDVASVMAVRAPWSSFDGGRFAKAETSNEGEGMLGDSRNKLDLAVLAMITEAKSINFEDVMMNW